MVLPGYMLAAYHKTDGYSTEGAIKYFLLGSFSSAIFLFGLAFVWGLTGSTRIEDVAGALTAVAADPGAFSPGPGAGLRVPDDRRRVQDRRRAVPLLDARTRTRARRRRSPGYLSVGPKIGAFALILRLFAEALGAAQGGLAAGRRSSSPR